MVRQLASQCLHRSQDPGNNDTGSALDIVVERAVLVPVVLEQPERVLVPKVLELDTEMEKRADSADISVLFFPGCANILAVYLQNS